MANFKTVLAWTGAIAAFAGVQIIANYAGAAVGVPVSLDVDPYLVRYGHGAEEFRDSITTGYGIGTMVLSVLAAVASWHLIQKKDITPRARKDFMGFLVGSVIVTIGGIVMWRAFEDTEGGMAVFGNMTELGLFGLAIYVGLKVSNRPTWWP